MDPPWPGFCAISRSEIVIQRVIDLVESLCVGTVRRKTWGSNLLGFAGKKGWFLSEGQGMVDQATK